MNSDECTWFVFYKLARSEYWNYDTLPDGWRWVGNGQTKVEMYPREEQFNGSLENKIGMHNYLEKYFTDLQETGVITRFHLADSYAPPQ